MLTVRSSFLICLSVFGLAFGILLEHESVALICLSILLLVWLQWLSFGSMRRSTRKFRESFVRLIDKQSEATITMVTDRTYEVELRFDVSRLRSGYRVTIQDVVPDGFVVSGLSQIVFESPRRSFLPSIGMYGKPRCLSTVESSQWSPDGTIKVLGANSGLWEVRVPGV